MRYQFINTGCPNAAKGCVGCAHEIEFPMANAPAIGALRKCPQKGCTRKVERILSTGISGVVKGAVHDWKAGETMHMQMPDGRNQSFSFVDHKHTDPAYQRNLATLAGKAGLTGNAHGLRNARYDEKHGRMVVDVASDIRDPLGAIERSKKDGTYTQEVKKVNQPYKVRSKKKKA